MAKLGRRRVAILYKGELEIPSDILGIVYHQFSNSIKEVGEDIRQILKTAGIGGTGQIIGETRERRGERKSVKACWATGTLCAVPKQKHPYGARSAVFAICT